VTVLKFDKHNIESALQRIEIEFRAGNPIVIPTDTLYGLAAPIKDHDALERIFHLKSRPFEMSLPVAVGELHMLDEICTIRRWQKNLLRENMPGNVTFILEAKMELDELVQRRGTIALRIPRHRIFLPLTSSFGPLGLTSANRHGRENKLTAVEIEEDLGVDVLILEDDGSLSGIPSSIIDITKEVPTMLREGNLNIDEFMGGDHGG
jgi:L-threonylcarbamoyladenylate synthase